MFNLELHGKVNGAYRHKATLQWSIPYPVAKAKKNIYTANQLMAGEFLKIVKQKGSK